MASQRIYPPQVCINPICIEIFNPYDLRQYFHNIQCRTNYNNDKRRVITGCLDKKEAALKINEWLLRCFFTNKNYPGGRVSQSSLNFLNFNFSLGEWYKNVRTNNPVLWFREYGLEMIDKNTKTLEIHKRSKIIV